ncbi:DUF2835 domain-containing protein [Halomonas elongata]|uniref:DUF2835 domain-containing protein n=1 Tax=Halomonas elongata TaxID=2746 RepID=UPI00186BA038|nr:DUF2835 domain-containing protein [Halomonas elongata]MBW5800219.1 DUF2835 domain-containing protein [Halomonas elongata]
MPAIDVILELSRDACLAHYEGRAGMVHARSLDGRSVAFPAEALRRVVTRDGVHGVFRLYVSPEGRFEGIRWLSMLPDG